jgi:hypothetical protein
MNDNRFWFLIWCLVAGSLVVPIIGLIANDAYGTARYTEMVERGADPIKVRCGLWGGDMDHRVDCNLLLVK